MKFKSKLGFAALEELTEDKAPEVGEGGEAKADAAVAAAPDAAAAAPAVAEGAAPATDTTGEAPAATGEAAPVVTPTEGADAAAAAAPAVVDAAAAAPAVTDAAAAAPAAVAPAPAEDPEAAQTSAAATSTAEATGEPAAVVAEAVGDVGDVGEAESEEVESEMEAVDKIEKETDKVNDDVEKLEVATEAMEGCVAILDAAAQRGGLDIFGASLLRNNVNTVTASLKVKNLVLPALEDMDDPSAKIDGAETAKSQLIAFINRIIKAIKDAFESLGAWIVETYNRLTNAYTAVENRANKLAERLTNATMKTGDLGNKALAKQMSVGGQVPEDVAGLLKKLGDFAQYLNEPKTYYKYLEVCDLCEGMVKNPEKTEEIRGKIATVVSKWSEEVGKHATDVSKSVRWNANFSGNGRIAEAVKAFEAPLFGNQVLQLMLPESAEGLRGMWSGVAEANKEPASAIGALDAKAAAEVCKTVAAIAKNLRESAEANKGGVKEITAEIKKRKDVIAAMATALGDEVLKDAGAGEKARKAILFVNSFFLSAPKLPIHAINRAMPRNLDAALNYVAASIASAAAAAPAAAPQQIAA